MARDSLFARWSHYQLSRLELVFAIIVILVLISVFLNYMVVMLARAEQAMVDNSITRINSALRLQAMQVYVDDAFTGIAAMRHANPVRLLEQQPEWDVSDHLESVQLATMVKARSEAALPNYAGEMGGDAATDLEPGSWYFDTDSRALVYIVRNAELFRSELPGRARLRYRLELNYDDQDSDGRFTPGIDRYRDVELQPVDDYQWLL